MYFNNWFQKFIQTLGRFCLSLSRARVLCSRHHATQVVEWLDAVASVLRAHRPSR
eukprot:COSAG06_NODE_33965_length_481_cov_2.303665_1_plen_54_part_10